MAHQVVENTTCVCGVGCPHHHLRRFQGLTGPYLELSYSQSAWSSGQIVASGPSELLEAELVVLEWEERISWPPVNTISEWRKNRIYQNTCVSTMRLFDAGGAMSLSGRPSGMLTVDFLRFDPPPVSRSWSSFSSWVTSLFLPRLVCAERRSSTWLDACSELVAATWSSRNAFQDWPLDMLAIPHSASLREYKWSNQLGISPEVKEGKLNRKLNRMSRNILEHWERKKNKVGIQKTVQTGACNTNTSRLQSNTTVKDPLPGR